MYVLTPCPRLIGSGESLDRFAGCSDSGGLSAGRFRDCGTIVRNHLIISSKLLLHLDVDFGVENIPLVKESSNHSAEKSFPC